MKAVFLIPSLSLGGAERALVKLANGLSDHAWSVQLIAFGAVDTKISSELNSAVGVSTTGRWSTANPWLWLVLWWRLRAASPDIVIGWSTYANLVAALPMPASRRWRVVVVERNYPPLLFRRTWTSPLRRSMVLRAMKWLYRRADVVGANSDFTLRFLRRFIGNGPAYVKFSNSISVAAVDGAAAEEVLDLPAQCAGPRLLAVGRLSHQKGFDVLLRALALVRQLRHWQLAIVGDGEERSSLEALAEALNLGNGLIWLGSRPNPFPYYRWADIIISSSRYEGSPNVLLEAMALGKATISTNCRTGPGELTERGHAGLLVPVNDAEALAAAIIRLGSDDNLRARLAERARARIVDAYGSETVVADIATALETVILPRSEKSRLQSDDR